MHLDDLKEYEAQEFTEEGEDLWFVKGDEGGPRDQEDELALVEDIRGHRTNQYRDSWSSGPVGVKTGTLGNHPTSWPEGVVPG